MKFHLKLPAEEMIRETAYFIWERRGRVHGYDSYDWMMAEKDLSLALNYNKIAEFALSSKTKTKFGDNTEGRQCRFCKRKRPEAKFSKTAHSIPAMLGNKALFSNDECNLCNEIGSKLESHLSNLTEMTLRLSNVKGRGGTKTYEGSSGMSSIVSAGTKIDVKFVQGNPLLRMDDDRRTIHVKDSTKPFVPAAIWKCLTKMALAIMPDDRIPMFARTCSWVIDQDHHNVPEGFRHDYGWLISANGFFEQGSGYVMLLERRLDDSPLPHMLFVVSFTNLAFQISVPFSQRDDHLPSTGIPLLPVPHGIYFRPEEGPPKQMGIPLISSRPQTANVNIEMSTPYEATIVRGEWPF